MNPNNPSARHSGEYVTPRCDIGRNPVIKPLKKQHGYALLVFVSLMLAAASSVAVKALNNGNSQIARDKLTAAALAQAKEALIGYAITYAENHPDSPQVLGYLPCPDTSGTDIGGEGAAASVCGAQDANAIGKLPWKTLDLPPLRGGDGECLWYAVSGTYKNNPQTGLMNWDTNGQLQVYSPDKTLLTPADNQAVAVIIAPGVALGSSHSTVSGTSSCSGNYLASNYVDNDTVHLINNVDIATGKFIQRHEDRDASGNVILTVNDQIAYITKQDIWNAMKKRESALLTKLDTMTLLTARCIADYGNHNALSGNHSLPWPTRLTLSDYGDTASYYDKKNLFAGRVPYQVDISRLRTGNIISSDYLLTKGTYNIVTSHWENNCLVAPDSWAAIYLWWYNWKEHLFYAVSQRFKPGNTATNPVCDSDHQCLHVNSPSNSGNYAAVVILAGKKLSGQTRTDKSIISSYLEGRNNSNMAGFAIGNENYQVDATSTTFNDIVYCIKEDLSVVKGTTAGCP